MTKNVTVSIVSHGHGAMVIDLCNKLLSANEVSRLIVTFNIHEPILLPVHEKLKIIQNKNPKGFAANHNAAFKLCTTKYFLVLNPDVLIDKTIFALLIEGMTKVHATLAAPLVKSNEGNLEDSIRRFPTFKNLFLKAIGIDISRYQLSQLNSEYLFPNWVAGMFMLFDSKAFASVNGFDENFFLYYEDVDICVRFWKKSYRIAVFTKASIIHDAQRDSRRKFRYMLWHIKSLLRYFYKHIGRLPKAYY